ncbi:MAG TPA: HlyD family efflux transporter periplasmic adaptor subunit [Xanthobacteraceae bacterium]|nr:HlyD family efflux transporter periplasmic adaptor subunit [Xanthobacteraceae bacterium]
MTWARAFALLAACGLAATVLAACGESRERSYQGWVEADLVFLSPDESGRLESLSVREGDHLAEGAPVFTLDADLQRAELNAAVAAVAEARARLARLENPQQRTEEIAVLEAQERRAEAALALSTKELERQKELAGRHVTSQAQLDTATANFNRDRAALDEIRRQIVVAKMSARKEDIVAAREALSAAEARRVSAETRLARRRVMAPAAGTVQQVYYRVGEMVGASRPVIALLPPAHVKLRFFVPQAVLPQIAVGEPVRVRCDGCQDEIAARISFIARSAEFTPPVIYSREERDKLVFLVEARPENPDRLRIGQPIDVLLDGASP